MRRIRNIESSRAISLAALRASNTSTATAPSNRRVSFAALDKDAPQASQPEEEANNDDKLLPGEEDEMASPDVETPRPSRNFTASELRLEQALTEDVYSLMYIAPIFSSAFAFASISFAIQFVILLMICKSLRGHLGQLQIVALINFSSCNIFFWTPCLLVQGLIW
jgi:hypothetical protein